MSEPLRRSIGNRIAPLPFIVFVVVFAAVTLLAGWRFADWSYAIMAGFDVGAALFFVMLMPSLRDASGASIRRRAAENDANRGAILFVSACVLLVLLMTVSVELGEGGQKRGALVILTLLLAWLFSNTMFALHYAHLYYGDRDGRVHGGLDFPGEGEPDYWDFFYFAFTLGMTFQTSDVAIPSRTIRRIVLAHSMAAFIFNIGILAFTINTLGN